MVTRAFNKRIAEIQGECRQAIEKRDNQMQFFQYGNVGLQSKIQSKDQEIVALQIHYIDYLTNEDKSIDKISLQRAIKKQNIPISLCANNIVIEGTRVER